MDFPHTRVCCWPIPVIIHVYISIVLLYLQCVSTRRNRCWRRATTPGMRRRRRLLARLGSLRITARLCCARDCTKNPTAVAVVPKTVGSRISAALWCPVHVENHPASGRWLTIESGRRPWCVRRTSSYTQCVVHATHAVADSQMPHKNVRRRVLFVVACDHCGGGTARFDTKSDGRHSGAKHTHTYIYIYVFYQ